MITIVQEAWSHEDNYYVIKEIELHLRPKEALIVSQALRVLSEDKQIHTYDRDIAKKMHHDMSERIAQCGGRGEDYDS